MNNRVEKEAKGCLYIVSTPIGNRDDITLRALKILDEVDFIAAEDTRKTGSLLSFYKIKNRLIAYHEHNESKCTASLIKKLHQGFSIALVSNAGTPSVSDPGYRLIKKAVSESIKIIPIPGVSAALTALSVAGLPTDSFIFMGFLSKKKGKRLKQLKDLASEVKTIIFYESTKRIERFIDEIIETLGDREGVVAREMTKLHEEFIRGHLSVIRSKLQEHSIIKGECTLIVSGATEKEKPAQHLIKDEIKKRLEFSDETIPQFAKDIAAQFGVSKKSVYNDAVKIKKNMSA